MVTTTNSTIPSSIQTEEDDSPSTSRENPIVQFSLPVIDSSMSSLIKTNERRIVRSATSKKQQAKVAAAAAAAAAAVAAHHYTKNKKAFRILCLVTCSLIIFWLPWIVSWPVQAYCHCLPRFFYTFTYWLEYLNSLVNSIILIVFNQHFRKKFLSLFFNFK